MKERGEPGLLRAQHRAPTSPQDPWGTRPEPRLGFPSWILHASLLAGVLQDHSPPGEPGTASEEEPGARRTQEPFPEAQLALKTISAFRSGVWAGQAASRCPQRRGGAGILSLLPGQGRSSLSGCHRPLVVLGTGGIGEDGTQGSGTWRW